VLGKIRKVKRAHKGKTVEYEKQQAVNNPQSTRGFYRHLKRLLRQGFALADLRPSPKAQDSGVKQETAEVAA
jgi:hypothetical protein